MVNVHALAVEALARDHHRRVSTYTKHYLLSTARYLIAGMQLETALILNSPHPGWGWK